MFLDTCGMVGLKRSTNTVLALPSEEIFQLEMVFSDSRAVSVFSTMLGNPRIDMLTAIFQKITAARSQYDFF